MRLSASYNYFHLAIITSDDDDDDDKRELMSRKSDMGKYPMPFFDDIILFIICNNQY